MLPFRVRGGGPSSARRPDPRRARGEGRRDPALHVFRETANPKPMLIVVGTRTFFAGVAVSW
jgi:hypothetical protein